MNLPSETDINSDNCVEAFKAHRSAWERAKEMSKINSTNEDRRKFKRVNLRLLMEFYDPDAAEGEQRMEMETINFSAGGFYCYLKKQMLPLTRLSLGFVFPAFGPNHTEERQIQCEAVVVRCDEDSNPEGKYRLAACFTSLSSLDRNYIEEYLEWYDTVYGWGQIENADENDPGSGDLDEDIA